MQEFKPENAVAQALLSRASPGSPTLKKFYKAASGYELDKRMQGDAADMKANGFTLVRSVKKIGRNQPCPCGSHRKFKKCCMVKAA